MRPDRTYPFARLLAATSVVKHRSWALGFGFGGSLSRKVVGWGVDVGRYGLRFHYPPPVTVDDHYSD